MQYPKSAIAGIGKIKALQQTYGIIVADRYPAVAFTSYSVHPYCSDLRRNFRLEDDVAFLAVMNRYPERYEGAPRFALIVMFVSDAFSGTGRISGLSDTYGFIESDDEEHGDIFFGASVVEQLNTEIKLNSMQDILVEDDTVKYIALKQRAKEGHCALKAVFVQLIPVYNNPNGPCMGSVQHLHKNGGLLWCSGLGCVHFNTDAFLDKDLELCEYNLTKLLKNGMRVHFTAKLNGSTGLKEATQISFSPDKLDLTPTEESSDRCPDSPNTLVNSAPQSPSKSNGFDYSGANGVGRGRGRGRTAGDGGSTPGDNPNSPNVTSKQDHATTKQAVSNTNNEPVRKRTVGLIINCIGKCGYIWTYEIGKVFFDLSNYDNSDCQNKLIPLRPVTFVLVQNTVTYSGTNKAIKQLRPDNCNWLANDIAPLSDPQAVAKIINQNNLILGYATVGNLTQEHGALALDSKTQVYFNASDFPLEIEDLRKVKAFQDGRRMFVLAYHVVHHFTQQDMLRVLCFPELQCELTNTSSPFVDQAIKVWQERSRNPNMNGYRTNYNAKSSAIIITDHHKNQRTQNNAANAKDRTVEGIWNTDMMFHEDWAKPRVSGATSLASEPTESYPVSSSVEANVDRIVSEQDWQTQLGLTNAGKKKSRDASAQTDGASESELLKILMKDEEILKVVMAKHPSIAHRFILMAK